MKINHVISTAQFLERDVLQELFHQADEMEMRDKKKSLPELFKGKVMTCVFYEPSTRTRFSFEAAMQKLGGKVITTESAGQFSSATKGESLQDTIKIMGGYADVIVLRHSEQGSAAIAAEVSTVPVINAGDGPGEHPTQALLDLYTIQKECKKIDGITIAMVGDLVHGRTIHSLVKLIAIYRDIKIYFVAPEQLRLPEEYKRYLREKNVSFEEVSNLKEVVKKVDVLYMTRVQKERFTSIEEYNQVKDEYIINKDIVSVLKKTAMIMHPLPRVNEIDPEIDSDPRAAYFRQAKNGLYIRMALLQMIFKGKEEQ